MPKKILVGKVINDKNEKTIIVMVERKYQHPFLKKTVNSKKKYHVHDEKKMFKVGDIVQIEESRPYSKHKRFKVLEKNI
jgi:small subunit ribosomal protein S17